MDCAYHKLKEENNHVTREPSDVQQPNGEHIWPLRGQEGLSC